MAALRSSLLAALVAAAVGACARDPSADAEYALGQCRRVTLIDAATGDAIVGAEDLAFDAAAERVLISAYDRRAAERDARTNALTISEGGIYATPFSALTDETVIVLPSLVARGDVAGGLRPHGLSFDPDRREIVFINRSYSKPDGAWRMAPRLERADAGGALVGDDSASPCSANDVIADGERTLVTFDHARCGWRGVVEELFNAKASGVATADGETLFADARFANGLARAGESEIALAATRDKSVYVLKPDESGLSLLRKIAVPGAPDNLTTTEEGMIVAALHPLLLRVALQRRLGIGRSGSRIVRIDTTSGAATLLFDDPEGSLVAAATVALERNGLLIIGSVADAGLVVCKAGGAAT